MAVFKGYRFELATPYKNLEPSLTIFILIAFMNHKGPFGGSKKPDHGNTFNKPVRLYRTEKKL